MSTAIAVKQLGKKYRLYNRGFDRVKEWLTFDHVSFHRDFWALQEIDFTVEKGMTYGVIGQNGAGKSTLLKILSGVSFPTTGTFEVNGRVSSLLELGAGFHPDFTGQENIYMNAVLMGLSRAEIMQKFPQIVDFSELGDFIGQPVKTYSSGMQARLGFSVAINVEPDILVIDEVLAVGDTYFQNKCLERLTQLRQQGVTILFCSHVLYQIQNICDEVLWLDQGRIKQRGHPTEVVEHYREFVRRKEQTHHTTITNDPKETVPRIEDVQPITPKSVFRRGDNLTLMARYHVPETFQHVVMVLWLKQINQNDIFATGSNFAGIYLQGSGKLEVSLENIPLLAGKYSITILLAEENWGIIYDQMPNVWTFRVESDQPSLGMCHIDTKWNILKE